MKYDRKKIPQMRAVQKAHAERAKAAEKRGDMREWDRETRAAKKVREEIVDIVKNAPDDDDDEPTMWQRR